MPDKKSGIWVVRLIEEPSGKPSITRVMFAIWGLGVLGGWMTGVDVAEHVLLFVAALGGLRVMQRFGEGDSDRR